MKAAKEVAGFFMWLAFDQVEKPILIRDWWPQNSPNNTAAFRSKVARPT
jgi:hypothetical protein